MIMDLEIPDVVIQDYGTDKAVGSVTGNVQFTANVSSSVLTLTATLV